jgi:hypothetical protein
MTIKTKKQGMIKQRKNKFKKSIRLLREATSLSMNSWREKTMNTS